jgi:ketosteroid isomerase-like protein
MKQAGGDTTSLSAEIDKAESAAQARQQEDANYRQVVQKYKQAQAANDKSGIDAARDNFIWIAKGAGPHADEARKYVSEINEKYTTSQPAPPPPPVTKQELPSTKALDEAAVRDVIKRYAQAYQQRDADAVLQIWPSIGNARYRKLKNTFEQLAELDFQVDIENLQVSSSGDQANVNGALTQSSTLKKGDKGKPRKDPVAFDLAKSNGKWIITGVR